MPQHLTLCVQVLLSTRDADRSIECCQTDNLKCIRQCKTGCQPNGVRRTHQFSKQVTIPPVPNTEILRFCSYVQLSSPWFPKSAQYSAAFQVKPTAKTCRWCFQTALTSNFHSIVVMEGTSSNGQGQVHSHSATQMRFGGPRSLPMALGEILQ